MAYAELARTILQSQADLFKSAENRKDAFGHARDDGLRADALRHAGGNEKRTDASGPSVMPSLTQMLSALEGWRGEGKLAADARGLKGDNRAEGVDQRLGGDRTLRADGPLGLI
jgi:hypothetical protein